MLILAHFCKWVSCYQHRSLKQRVGSYQRQALSIRYMETGRIEDKQDYGELKSLVTSKEEEVKPKKDVTKLN